MTQFAGLTVVSGEKDKVAPALLGAPLVAENLKLTSEYTLQYALYLNSVLELSLLF